MKKILALLLAVMMVAGLFAGCGEKAPAETAAPETEAPAAAETTAAAETEAAETEAPAAGVITKVALVTDVGTIDDEAFNQACWQGVEAWCTANNIEYNYYQPTEDSTDARVISVAQAIEEGANAIIMPGFLFGQTVLTVQNEYPDVYFVAVDVAGGDLTFDYQTFEEPAANVACLTFSEVDAHDLTGLAFVLTGQNNNSIVGSDIHTHCPP